MRMIYHIRSALAALTGGDGAARQSLPGTRTRMRTRTRVRMRMIHPPLPVEWNRRKKGNED